MDAARFALVKQLFDQVCDLPEQARIAHVHAATDDAGVIAEVLALTREGNLQTGRFAAPVLHALARLDAAALCSGAVLGAWTLGEEIGHGGMGRVFKAQRSDGHFRQVAAIKLLAGVSSRAALEYLARERQILASLSHPNIARLLDGGSTPQGQPYLVMDYVDGTPVDQYCAKHRLATTAVLELLQQVCAAVSFAHQQLVVHCDLKPSNILVSGNGRPVLLDFGVSRLLGEAGAETGSTPATADTSRTGMAYTPRYASPEQKAGARVGAATDVYSLGLVLAELLGVPLTEGQPLPLAALPRDLAAVIACATRPAAAERYASVDAFAADLQRYRSRRPIAARTPTAAYRMHKWTSRHWPWLAAAGLFLLTVTAFSWRMRVERDNALGAEQAARAVKDYMISVFQGADPEVSGQRDLPISAVLDAGREGLAARLRDQPLVRAEITGILGSVYQTIGKREEALRMFDQAIAIERGNQRPLVLSELLYKRAFTTYDMEDFLQAEPIAREALQIREQQVPESALLVDSLRLLGTIVLYQERREEAQALLTRALAMSIRVSGEDSVETARVHLDFGRFHAFLDLVPSAAITHARRAQQIVAQRLGSDHHLYADALEILAIGLGTTGAFDQALPLARELSDKRIRLYGEISYQGGYALFSYASLLNDAGQRLQALPILERCLLIQEQLDGKATLSSTVPLLLLARVQKGLGAYDEALASFAQLIELRTRLLPEANRELVDLQSHIGQIKRLQGHLDEAQDITAAVLKQRQDNPATHPYWVMQSQLEMAAVLRRRGQLDAASTLLASIDPQAFAGAAWQQGYIDRERGLVAAAQGQADQAQTLLSGAEAQLAQGLGEDHPDLWLLRLDRAEWLAASGHAAAARALAAAIADKAKASIAAGGDWQQRLAALSRADAHRASPATR